MRILMSPPPVGGKDERALGEVHLPGDRLHHGGVDRARFRKHRELIAFEGVGGEDIEVQVAHDLHHFRFRSFGQGAFA